MYPSVLLISYFFIVFQNDIAVYVDELSICLIS